MTRVLVINTRVPWPLDDGNALRVYQLARHLDPDVTCHLACLDARGDGLADLARQDVFASVTVLPPVPAQRHWGRYLRRGGDRDYHRLTYPDHFRQSVQLLQDLVDRENIDVVVAVLARCEEFMRPLRGVVRIVDQYDSASLLLEHELAEAAATGRGWRERLRLRRRLAVHRATEAALGDHCDLIVSISPADVACLQARNPRGAPVHLLPNGVEERLLDLAPAADPARGVAFWGDLGYDVNRVAVDYFYREVWLPLLEPAGVRWTIVGPRAGTELRALADQHPLIDLPGYVDDLYAHLAPYPVMVNPMRMGTGLKNKVLEAMAAGMAVVTTPLGVAALPFEDGKHGRIASAPQDFGRAVLTYLDDPPQREAAAARARELVRSRYTWVMVGSAWSSFLRK